MTSECGAIIGIFAFIGLCFCGWCMDDMDTLNATTDGRLV